MAAVVGGGEEDKRGKEGGIVELPVATVRFLLGISLLPNPFSQCSLRTSGPAALTRPNPPVHTYTQRYHSMATNYTHRRMIFTSYKVENTHQSALGLGIV